MSKTKKAIVTSDIESDSSSDEPDIEVPADTVDDMPEEDLSDEEVVDQPEVIDVGPARVHENVKVVVIVAPRKMRTPSTMSPFEMTEHISQRACQIARWNNCMVDITGLKDPVDMAKRELMMRRSPLTLRRHVGDLTVGGAVESYYEMWSPNDMTFSLHYDV